MKTKNSKLIGFMTFSAVAARALLEFVIPDLGSIFSIVFTALLTLIGGLIADKYLQGEQ